MAPESMHVAVGIRDAARAHGDSDLVQRFGKQCPEVPVVVGTAHVRLRITFDGVVKVGELQRIAQEEYRRVVSHQVPVALFRIELHGEAAYVTLGVGSSTFSGYGREADKAVCLLAYLAEDGGFRVAGDIVCDGKSAVRTRTFGMHTAFGDYFPVEMCEFFDQPGILQ